MIQIALTVNDETLAANVEARTTLADCLRDCHGLTGTHLGCEHGVCGACTVMLNGKPVRSCIMYAVQATGQSVRTIEGFGEDPVMRELRVAFNREHALQCGFCTPGMLVAARDIVTRLGDPGEVRVREELAGNLCRCTGYVGIVRAIRSVGRLFPVSEIRAPLRQPIPATAVSNMALPALAPIAPKSVTSNSAFRVAEHSASTQIETSRETIALGAGATEISHYFAVPSPIETVWTFFDDVRQVAACLPGAELLTDDPKDLRGRIRIRIGPIKAMFTGHAVYERNDRGKTGIVSGSGTDNLSKSRVSAWLEFRLSPAGPDETRVDLRLAFALKGALAQFSRSSIAQEFVRRVADEFAQNVSARIVGGAAATRDQILPEADFNVVGFFMSALWQRIRSIFSK